VIDLRGALKIGAVAVVAVLGMDRFAPSVTLALLPHQTVARPDPHVEPVQGETENGERGFDIARGGRTFHIAPRATYDISAKVVAREHFLAGSGALIPWDLALVWGPLVDEPYRSKLSFFQYARIITASWRVGSFDRDLINAHMANNHLIPATPGVLRAIAHIRTGDIVRLEGDLVDATAPGFEWRTSLTRTDTGLGACETIWVKAVTVETGRYE